MHMSMLQSLLRVGWASELFYELLLQLVLDGFVDREVMAVSKSETINLTVEFKTTVKGNKWIYSRVIDPMSLEPQPNVEELIRLLLSGEAAPISRPRQV